MGKFLTGPETVHQVPYAGAGIFRRIAVLLQQIPGAAVRQILPELLKEWQVIRLCGKGNLDSSLTELPGYVQYEYISAQLKDLFAMSDLMISRAGANSICEILALRKPNILIPLSAAASRGDQLLNAASFKKQGFSEVLEEEALTADSLLFYQNGIS